MALPSTLLIIFSSAALVFGHLYPAIETTSDIFQTQVPFSEKYSQAQKKLDEVNSANLLFELSYFFLF